ncbi:MAG: FAD-dependent oxidoreductase [Spirochaetes bacterium]|nr:MAG: FAD-dependent oxidoreductase [Spirochaetota bacterium]
MKNRASVVIIGGGVVGCSIAYNLARKGVRDIVLLEKHFLCYGSTGRCGAGVRQQWGTERNCILARESMKIFENMNEELATRRDIELKQGGYLLLAYSEKELELFRKNIRLQNRLDIPSKEVTPLEAKEIVPYLNTERLVGGAFCPTDGHANPFLVTQAYADAARRLGVEIELYTEATGIRKKSNRIVGVETSRGFIETEKVVNAAGGYSVLVSKMAGVEMPVYSERHQILATEPVEKIQGPMVMSFSYNIYCQQTPQGNFLMGYGDPEEPKGINTRSTWQFLETMAEKVTWLLPPLRHLRVVRQWAGLYNITPDKQPIICEVEQLPGFYLAIGFSGHGFMIAPMVGILISRIITGEPVGMELKLDLERFERGELTPEPAVV